MYVVEDILKFNFNNERMIVLRKRIFKEEDFVWKEKRINNRETNPIEYWYTAYYIGDSAKKYYIVPQFPLVNGSTKTDLNSEPELYIFFKSIGRKLRKDEKENRCRSIGDGFVYSKGTFKRACKTLDEAKSMAYRDYLMIHG